MTRRFLLYMLIAVGVVTSLPLEAQLNPTRPPSSSSTVFRGPNGAASAPTFSFTNFPTTGMYVSSGAVLNLASSGSQSLAIGGSDPFRVAWGNDAVITRDGAAHTLAMRSAANAQRFGVYNTFTSTSNYEAFMVDWQTTANVALIGTRTAATGTARPALFAAQNSNAVNQYAGMFVAASQDPRLKIGLFDASTAVLSVAANGTSVNIPAWVNTVGSGSTVAVSITPTYNQSASTAANTDLLVNRTNTSVGSGNQFLIDLQVGGVSQFLISTTSVVQVPNGSVWQWATRNKFTSNGDGLTNILSSGGAIGTQFNVGTADVTVTTCGTGTVTAGSRNTGGEITATGATACTVTFASPAWTNTPFCVVTEVTAARALFISASSTTAFTVSGLTAGDVFKYHCVGRI